MGEPGSQNGQCGIYSGPKQHDNRYAHNYITYNGRLNANNQLDHGLYLCGDSEIVTYNVITHNASYGIQVAGGSTVSRIKIYNNVLAFNGVSGIVLWLNIVNADIKNNIFYKNATFGIRTSGATGSGNMIDYNLFYGNSNGSWSLSPAGFYSLGNRNILNKDPLFLDENSFDLKTESPAINAGTNVGLPYLGKAPDIGYVEKQ